MAKKRRRRRNKKSGYQRHGTAFPGWGDLSSAEGSSLGARTGSLLERTSTGRFALFVLVLAAAVTLYVGHVHATQDLLVRLQDVQQENQRLHIKYDRLSGEFDRATGPSVVYKRAKELGLEESVVSGPTIYLSKEE